jgi:hypothetical protein
MGLLIFKLRQNKKPLSNNSAKALVGGKIFLHSLLSSLPGRILGVCKIGYEIIIAHPNFVV